MAGKLIAAMSISLKAPLNKVWNALTDPTIIKEYLFGTETSTDWKKGSPITYRGEWDGKPYEDKGQVVDVVPGRRLHTTYYSPLQGREDKPENYKNVIYELDSSAEHTILTLSQDNIDSEDELLHAEANWSRVLDNMKRVVER